MYDSLTRLVKMVDSNPIMLLCDNCFMCACCNGSTSKGERKTRWEVCYFFYYSVEYHYYVTTYFTPRVKDLQPLTTPAASLPVLFLSCDSRCNVAGTKQVHVRYSLRCM